MLPSIASVCLLVASSVSDEPPRSLATHPWGRWQPGAWVETRTTGSGPGAVVERDQLLHAGRDEYELESVRKVPGADDAPSRVRHTWAFGGFAQHVPGAKLVGHEDVVVAGRRYPCEVWEARTEFQGQPMVDRSWLASDVDLPLRIVSSSADGGVELAATKLDDYVRIAGRKLRCVRYQGKGSARRSAFRMAQWVTLDVPGGVVRLDTSAQTNGTTATFRREVTAFRGEVR